LRLWLRLRLRLRQKPRGNSDCSEKAATGLGQKPRGYPNGVSESDLVIESDLVVVNPTGLGV